MDPERKFCVKEITLRCECAKDLVLLERLGKAGVIHHTPAVGVVFNDVGYLLVLILEELLVHIEEEVVGVLLVLKHGEGLVRADGGEEGRRETHIQVWGGAQCVGGYGFYDVNSKDVAVVVANLLILSLGGGEMDGAQMHFTSCPGARGDGEFPPE